MTEGELLRLLKRRFGWTSLGPHKLYKTRWLAEAAVAAAAHLEAVS
jgi:hypothetical protein